MNQEHFVDTDNTPRSDASVALRLAIRELRENGADYFNLTLINRRSKGIMWRGCARINDHAAIAKLLHKGLQRAYGMLQPMIVVGATPYSGPQVNTENAEANALEVN